MGSYSTNASLHIHKRVYTFPYTDDIRLDWRRRQPVLPPANTLFGMYTANAALLLVDPLLRNTCEQVHTYANTSDEIVACKSGGWNRAEKIERERERGYLDIPGRATGEEGVVLLV